MDFSEYIVPIFADDGFRGNGFIVNGFLKTALDKINNFLVSIEESYNKTTREQWKPKHNY